MELANEEREIKLIDGLVNSVFEKADLEKRQEINFQDFKRLLADYGKELNYVSLNMQCKFRWTWSVRSGRKLKHTDMQYMIYPQVGNCF